MAFFQNPLYIRTGSAAFEQGGWGCVKILRNAIDSHPQISLMHLNCH
jgi:hypothetical protein